MNNRNVEKLVNSKSVVHNLYLQIISLNNLFAAWREFKIGKEKKADVISFGLVLENNIFTLHNELLNLSYEHSNYISFKICDPKLRHIHKAKVRDRVLHHAIVRVIEPIFDQSFIFDSYSSRKNKGTHKAILRLKQFAWKLSKNNSKIVWALKCDIKKFFDSVDHKTLLGLINKKVFDLNLFSLLAEIITSYPPKSRFAKCKSRERERERGIPLGNLTSQIFSNIYLNPLDQFIKRELKEKYYIRYADDFVILHNSKQRLEQLIFKLQKFLALNLRLQLHYKKVIVQQWSRGIDFLGYVIFPHHIIIRTKTKRRIFKKIKSKVEMLKAGVISKESFDQSIQSYLGVLKHCRSLEIKKKIIKITSGIFNGL